MRMMQKPPTVEVDLAKLVRDGLSALPRRLPPVLFYDAVGSELFDRITRTEEYYPTRTEQSVFDENACDIISSAAAGHPLDVIELGAGSASKTTTLLRALVEIQGPSRYVPIDVSEEAIVAAAARLKREIHGLRVDPVVGRNRASLAALDRHPHHARLVLFIGSSIGNYDREEAHQFLCDIARDLAPEDSLLLGTDLQKDGSVLEAAYNDAEGVTAQFNLNVLARLNRELGADFDLDRWRHVAFYNADEGRIEMHLESAVAQTVRIPGAGIVSHFHAGERIHTENSHKYTPAIIEQLAGEVGLRVQRLWMDPRSWFAVHLLRRV